VLQCCSKLVKSCLSVKQLGCGWDAELLVVSSGSKLFAFCTLVVSGGLRVKKVVCIHFLMQGSRKGAYFLFLHQILCLTSCWNLSHWDNSNKWSNIGFREEITQVELIEFNSMHLNWSSLNVNFWQIFLKKYSSSGKQVEAKIRAHLCGPWY